VSTRVDGARALVLVIVRATLSAGPVHLTLSAKEGPAPGTWRYNLTDGPDHRAACGRVAGKDGHMDVLRYAAGICATNYQPGTTERGLLEQFAAAPPEQDSPLP
jgi:NAD(P)-dependent dehydrogenase (short-subunit alcohol dehydrogenase family)